MQAILVMLCKRFVLPAKILYATLLASLSAVSSQCAVLVEDSGDNGSDMKPDVIKYLFHRLSNTAIKIGV